MSSYVVTHMKNSNHTGSDSMNWCGNLDILTSHIAVRMLAMVCAVTSSLTMMSIFLNGSVTSNAKNYIRLSQTASRSGQTDRQTGAQTASRSNQTFFCYPDRPTDRQKRHVLYMMLESDSLIIIQHLQHRKQHPDPISHFFLLSGQTDRQTGALESDALYDARERRANNNANSIQIQSAIFCYNRSLWC